MRISDWSSDVCSSDLLGTDSESAAKARSHNHADGDEGNEAGNDDIYAGWNNDSISGDAQAIADGHAESDSVNNAERPNSQPGNDLILAGGRPHRVPGYSPPISPPLTPPAFVPTHAAPPRWPPPPRQPHTP